MRSIAARFLFPFGFFAILISLFVFYRTYDASRRHAHELISQQAAMALEFNLAIREYAGAKIRPFAETFVGKDVFIPELMSTSYISRTIFEEVRAKFPHFIVRFSSENPRNPLNIANADEMRMIEYFRNNPHVGQVTDEIQIDGKRYMAHFTPKWMKPECMQCHDDPRNAPAGLVQQYGAKASFHRKVGDVAGLDTVAVPIESVDDFLAVEMRSRSLTLAFGIALLFAAIIVVFRYVVARRLAAIARHFNEIAANAGSPSMTPVLIKANDEIGSLGMAFNKLLEQLRETHASLEARVARRTDELRNVNGRLEAELAERRIAEEALRQSEESFRRIAENMHDLVCQTDYRCMYQYVSPSYQRILGYGPAELTGESIFARIHPDDRTRVEAECEWLIRTGEDREVEFRYRHADGHYMWFVTAWNPLYDSAGEFGGVVFNSRDITTRKCAEDLLRQSEEKFSQIFQTTSLSIVISRGDDETLIDVNPGFVASTGYAREDAIGRSIRDLDLRVGPLVTGRPLSAIGLDGEIFNKEVTFRRRNGTVATGMCSIQKLVLDGQECMLLVMQDITEHKTAAKEKEHLQAQLIQAQRMESIGRLAGGVAHDFNNMLSVILGRAQLSLDRLDPGQPLYRNILEIRKAAERSADLTRQLLAFARRQTVNPVIIDLNDTISGMLSIFQRLVGEDIHLDLVSCIDLWKIKIDPSQIDQILANLIVNGRDAILGVGSITLKTENVVVEHSMLLEHPELVPGEYVLLTVSDTGTGIDTEVIDHLFEPFFTTKEVGKGTGLGLATVYGIVKQNNGFIYVESVLGRGAVFKIYIPRVDDEAVPSTKKETPRLKMGTETILLVEDDESVLNLGKMILEIEGYNVLAARFPREAIQLSEALPGEIHLLVTDVVMPEMNGRELVERLGATRPGLRCLYMSGYTADVIAHRGILDEGINFIQKPFTRDDFTQKIARILNNTGQSPTVEVSGSPVELTAPH
ncbi:MAG: PAS domain S-box protein [Syntrophobacter sp.]